MCVCKTLWPFPWPFHRSHDLLCAVIELHAHACYCLWHLQRYVWPWDDISLSDNCSSLLSLRHIYLPTEEETPRSEEKLVLENNLSVNTHFGSFLTSWNMNRPCRFYINTGNKWIHSQGRSKSAQQVFVVLLVNFDLQICNVTKQQAVLTSGAAPSCEANLTKTV